jgi:hypothetical protein
MMWLQPGWKDFVALAMRGIRSGLPRRSTTIRAPRQATARDAAGRTPGQAAEAIWQPCPRAAMHGARARRAFWAGPVLVVPIALVLGGCFLAPWSPDRPDPASVSGPPVYVERCEGCHDARVGARYAASAHTANGIRCGQCHRPQGHPDFAQPVQDTTCGGCHQPEYQQTLVSQHFATRLQRPLDADRAARVLLRRERFTMTTAGGRHFVGDSTAGELGGRLCAACHYDEHRLGVDAVQRQDFCTGCHAGRDQHYPMSTSGPTNRCVQCHVRVGETATGTIVNTHRFER